MIRIPFSPVPRAASTRLPVLLAAALLGACGPSPDGGGALPKDVAYAARPLVSSDSTAELSQVGAVTVDSRGSVYVADMGAILVFGPDGRVQRRLGREGDGPGEFRSFAAMEILPGDSLYVFDSSQQRATVFRPYSSEVAYTLRLNGEDFTFPSQVRPVGGTHTLVGVYRMAVGDVRGAQTERRDVLRVFNPDGSLRRDSVLTLREPERLELSAGRTHGYFWPEFARRGIVRFGPDGRIYSAWTDVPQVSVYDVEGRTRAAFTARVEARPLRLTEADIDSAATRIAQPPFDKAPAAQALRERWTTWPVVEDLLVDDASRVWLKLRAEGAAEGTWMAFGETGERVASVSLPANAHPRLIRGDRVYAAVLDEVDVPTLVVYQLVPAAPARGVS